MKRDLRITILTPNNKVEHIKVKTWKQAEKEYAKQCDTMPIGSIIYLFDNDIQIYKQAK